MKYPGTVNGNGTQPHISTAEEWRQRRAERARGKAVPLTLPSGIIIKLVRPQISAWFGTAKLPEVLSKNIISIFGDGSIEPKSADEMTAKVAALSEEEQTDLVEFMNRLMLEAVVEPQLVDKRPEDCKENEFALADLDEEERGLILYVIMSGVPNQPVPVVDGGEVSLEQLDNFPEKKRSPRVRKTGRKVPRTTE